MLSLKAWNFAKKDRNFGVLKLIERRIMYKDRGGFGGGSSRSDIVGGPLDRKRINDALDKHLEKSSPSTSRGLNNSSKDKERLSVPSTSTGKSLQHHQQQLDHHRADSRSASLSKNKCSDGTSAFSWFFMLNLIIFNCFCASGIWVFAAFVYLFFFFVFSGID